MYNSDEDQSPHVEEARRSSGIALSGDGPDLLQFCFRFLFRCWKGERHHPEIVTSFGSLTLGKLVRQEIRCVSKDVVSSRGDVARSILHESVRNDPDALVTDAVGCRG